MGKKIKPARVLGHLTSGRGETPTATVVSVFEMAGATVSWDNKELSITFDDQNAARFGNVGNTIANNTGGLAALAQHASTKLTT